jgi:AcrR family transcriptional regulator
MPKRDAEDKRRRLLAAGLAEFAAHGIVGARVDRIAKRAGCSTGLVYTYFTSKDELFETVFDSVVAQTLTEAPITPNYLPDYAVRLFDATQSHPEAGRLLAWYDLERTGTTRPSALRATQAKVDAIRDAQRAGVVTDRFEATQVLYLVLHLARDPVPDPVNGMLTRSGKRETIREAVRRLVEP